MDEPTSSPIGMIGMLIEFVLGLFLFVGTFGYPQIEARFPLLWEYVVNPLNIWTYY